jgi:uroporphyrinogen decarboxylase
MRQAGRYLPEYLAVRERASFWEMCTVPELTVEVTLQPVRRLGVDAAILFSDILVPLAAIGLDVEFRPAPAIAEPIRRREDLARLDTTAGDELFERIGQSIRILRRELEGKVPLIGFGGSPFTLATYAVGGGASRDHAELRALLFGDPETAHALLERMRDTVCASLTAQIEAGVQAIQLFDSWAGILSPDDYRTFALPYARQVLHSFKDSGVPRIYFAPGASSLLPEIAEVGAEAIGVDWRIALRDARRILGDRVAVQGNLDPGVLLGSRKGIVERTRAILEEGRGAKGHIVNLGHGILPETPVENAQVFVEAVQSAPPSLAT